MNHLSTFPLRTLTKLNMYFTLIINCSLKRLSLLYLLFAFVMERANFPMQRAAAFLLKNHAVEFSSKRSEGT